MGYLITEFALLFLLATVLGFLLGHWWSRRQFVDVTESFSSLTRSQRDSDDRWQMLSGELSSLTARVEGFKVPETDLSPLQSGLTSVERAVSGIKMPQAPDLSSIETAISALQRSVGSIKIPDAPDLGALEHAVTGVRQAVDALDFPPPDLSSLHDGITTLSSGISGIRLPETDLSALSSQLARLQTTVDGLKLPESTDLEPLHAAVRGIGERVAAIRMPEAANLAPVTTAVQEVAKKVDNIRIPQPADVSPLAAQLTRVEGQLGRIPKPEPVNLAPVQQALASVSKTVNALDTRVDLTPLSQRLDTLEATVRKMPVVNTHPAVDIGPLRAGFDRLRTDVTRLKPADTSAMQKRLDAIEALLRQRPKPTPAPAPKPKPAKPKGPALFKSAVHGKKDDLKRISGVGPMLEGLLNKHGVYYFWQVASWSRADITFIDDRLDVFKGRIERDEWVRQAKTLRRSPGAAQAPANG